MAAAGIALGRDPLQADVTAYEVLGIERTAGPAEIDRAFRQGLVKRGNVPKLTAAKIALERPLERAVSDLFLYDVEALRALAPSPLDDPNALLVPQRGAIALEWENQLSDHFADPAIAHGLAVLWYWWAVDGRERGATDSGPALIERWHRAIGYWAVVIAHDDFLGEISPVPAGTLRDALVERLSADLRKVPSLSRESSEGDHGGLDLVLRNECDTARELYGAGLRTDYGKLACGPLLLKQYGILDNLRGQLEGRLKQQPGDRRIARLAEMLSDCAPFHVLLAAGRPADALVGLDALPEERRAQTDVATLRARALLELGRQQASVQRFEVALESWNQALLTAVQPDLRREIRGQVISACRRRAAALAHRPEQSIAILERALEIAADPSLALALAELLHQRGTESALGAKHRIDALARETKDILGMLARSVADLERAMSLGSEQAREDIAILRSLVEQANLLRATADPSREDPPASPQPELPGAKERRSWWQQWKSREQRSARAESQSRPFALFRQWSERARSKAGG